MGLDTYVDVTMLVVGCMVVVVTLHVVMPVVLGVVDLWQCLWTWFVAMTME